MVTIRINVCIPLVHVTIHMYSPSLIENEKRLQVRTVLPFLSVCGRAGDMHTLKYKTWLIMYVVYVLRMSTIV